ncbi:MAG: oligopeptide:H+ symporter [Thermoguttaceae bacterium]
MAASSNSATLWGHPTGLFGLFFVEMWERFSFYGMRALLFFYMTKDFLHYGDSAANTVYGAYTSLVYMAPLFGGMLADRLLGQRRAVILGGLLMAAGHFMMTIESRWAFYSALALLICGNGFFKPNISTIVGTLYPPGSPKRDGGFTIFYLGINLGAAMSPLLCSFVGDAYGRHWGFGLATAGMLAGVALFVAPTGLSRFLILLTALGTAAGLLVYRPDDLLSIGMNVFVAVALLIAGGVAWVALGRGGLPPEAGAPPDSERPRKPIFGPLSREWLLYLGTAVAVVLFIFLVSGVGPLFRRGPVTTIPHTAASKQADEGRQPQVLYGEPLTLVPQDTIEHMKNSREPLVRGVAVVVEEGSRPAGLVLFLAGLACLVYLLVEMVRLDRIARHRMYVVLILTFFSMLFFAFFEQAGSSLNSFTDRNVQRVLGPRTITPDEVGQALRIQPTQEQLGYHNGRELFTLDVLDSLRKEHEKKKDPYFEIDWTVAPDNVGMGVAARLQEIPAATFQSVNAIYILIFGPLLAGLWSFLGDRGWDPSTPVKFALGLFQLGVGFGLFWCGTWTADARGIVALFWLMLAYLPYTTGELCLSPVGLSMVTRLSPARLVSTVMGTWFLASAYAQLLAAMIAQATSVVTPGGRVPVPAETVHVYGNVWGAIAIFSLLSAAICLALAPLLNRWMHPEVDQSGQPQVMPEHN